MSALFKGIGPIVSLCTLVLCFWQSNGHAELINGEVLADQYSPGGIVNVGQLIAALDAEVAARASGEPGAALPSQKIPIRFTTAAYRLTEPLVLKHYDRVKLSGDGMNASRIELDDDFYTEYLNNSANKTKRVAIVMQECTFSKIESLQLNGRASEVDHPDSDEHYPGTYGILLSSCNDCDLYKVRTANLGGNSSTALAGHIVISAVEDGEPLQLSMPESLRGFTPVYSDGSTRGAGSERNTVRKCDLLDDHPKSRFAAFGLRLKSSWRIGRADNEFAYPVTNTEVTQTDFIGSLAVGSRLAGGFIDNALEIGGPGCTGNEVGGENLGCVFMNCSQAPMECDKGARFNKFTHNLVDGVHLAGNPMHSNLSKVYGRYTVAMRDAGLRGGHNNGVHETRYAKGNVFNHNTVINVEGVGPRTGLAMVTLSRDASFFDNDIDWLSIQVVHPVTAPSLNPAVIVATGFDQIDVENLRFKDNTPLPESSVYPIDMVRTLVRQDEVGYDDALPNNQPQRVVMDIHVRHLPDGNGSGGSSGSGGNSSSGL